MAIFRADKMKNINVFCNDLLDLGDSDQGVQGITHMDQRVYMSNIPRIGESIRMELNGVRSLFTVKDVIYSLGKPGFDVHASVSIEMSYKGPCP